MALESATFYIDDYKGRHYKVHAVADRDENYRHSLWCMVHRCIIGIDDSAERNRVYEEDYSAEFCLYVEDCLDLDDDIEVETVIQQKFNDAFWVKTWIDDADFNEEEECENQKEMDKEIVKHILADYHNLDLENVNKAVALANLARIAERMAEILEEKFG